MSTTFVKIEALKAYLRVTQNEDDELLQDLLAQAEDEVLVFMDRKDMPRRGQMAVDECASDQSPIFDSNEVLSNGHWPGTETVSDSDDLAPSVRGAIYLIAQGMYEAKDAAEMQAIRKAAETKCFPYRNRVGV